MSSSNDQRVQIEKVIHEPFGAAFPALNDVNKSEQPLVDETKILASSNLFQNESESGQGSKQFNHKKKIWVEKKKEDQGGQSIQSSSQGQGTEQLTYADAVKENLEGGESSSVENDQPSLSLQPTRATSAEFDQSLQGIYLFIYLYKHSNRSILYL